MKYLILISAFIALSKLEETESDSKNGQCPSADEYCSNC